MNEEILKELKDIKKLLMLLLSKNKATNVEIGKVLGVTEGAVRQHLSKSK